MITPKFDPQSFFQRTDNVALHVPASELFGLLKRSIDLPPQWGALVARSAGDHTLVRAGGVVESDDVAAVLFVRLTPVDCQVTVENLVSRDGYSFAAEVQFRTHPMAECAELHAFLQAVVGSRRVVQAEGIKKYLQQAIHGAMATFVGERDAAQLMDAQAPAAASESLMAALQVPCFTAGILLEQRLAVTFDSGSFQRVQKAREVATASRAEHEAASQVDEALHKARREHLDQLATTLVQLRELAAQSPDTKLPDLIRTFSERQRGELYESLFASEQPSTRTQWIVAAAAEELLFFDPAAPDSPSRRLKIEGEAGQARSVQTATSLDGRAVLIVGAATGVYLWPIDRSSPESTFLVADPPHVRGGFNAAVLVDHRLFATHSELGIYEWNASEPTSGKARFESMTCGAKAVRDVEFFEGDLYCSIDDRIIRWPSNDPTDRPSRIYTGSSSIITALCPSSHGLFAGNSDGDVLHWPAERDTEPERVHRGQRRATESIWLLESHGVRRLIHTDTSHRVHTRVLGDTFTCHYEASGQTLRRVEVAPDLIVATTELRDKLICWTPGKPDKPFASIALASLTGRSIQDVCLV